MTRKVMLDYLRETYAWCTSCQQFLKHDRGYCPKFPDDAPPPALRKLCTPIATPMGVDTHEDVPGKKWTTCVCLVHTCFDNPRKLSYAGFERARSSVSHYAFFYDGVTLCHRTPLVVGGSVQDPFRQGTCWQCMRALLVCAHVYCDRP